MAGELLEVESFPRLLFHVSKKDMEGEHTHTKNGPRKRYKRARKKADETRGRKNRSERLG